jgi:hypothetical protein
MARNRFADEQETVRLDLSDGDWIDVRRELGYGRQSRMAAAGLGRVQASALDGTGDAEVGLSWEGFGFARMEAWVVNWSFRDRDNRPRPCDRRNMEALHPETVKEIIAALDTHQEEQNTEHASPNGRTTPTPV